MFDKAQFFRELCFFCIETRQCWTENHSASIIEVYCTERERMIMLHIGLTGGIASGKSTVVTMLREFGAGIVDCDVIAHDVVLPGTKGLEAVAAAFGPKALCEDGSMDRAYIGSLVFQDKAKKAQLEGLLFPLIHDGIEEEIRKIEEDKKNPVIFLNMARIRRCQDPTSAVDAAEWLFRTGGAGADSCPASHRRETVFGTDCHR